MSEEIVARVKFGARWLWSQGDYTKVALALEPEAKALARRCVRPGLKVLDVAAGNGNFSIAAARLGADVTATDMSPHMVELGGARSQAEGLAITWQEADAESLPFPDASFDLAASVFGAMFAPRPDIVARELMRVVRPGGTVAMANYGPGGYLARLAGVLATYSTTPATTFPSPFLWGDENEVRRRFDGAERIEIDRRTLTLGYESFEAWRMRFAAINPPIRAMEQILPPEAYARLIEQCGDLATELNTAGDGGITLESDVLFVLVTSPRG